MFDEMPTRDLVSWTATLSRYAKKGLFKEALNVFRDMLHAGIKANEFTYGSALMSCTKLKCLGTGKQVQGCVEKSGFMGNLFVQSALVDLHCKCGCIEDASYVFGSMNERDLVSWNGMIGGFAVNGFATESFVTFRSMLREGVSPDHFTLGSLLGSCNQGLHLFNVQRIHAFVFQLGFESHGRLGAQLVDAYAKCGSISDSSNIFESIPEKDMLSYTAMINGYAQEAKHVATAFILFAATHRSGIEMDDVLLCSMLNICANRVSLNLGRQIHGVAIKYCPGYDVAMSNALIDMYAKCGELEEAQRAFDEQDEKNIISWSSLIGGYAQHGHGGKAIAIFKRMENEGIKPNHITVLSLLFGCSQTGLVSDGLTIFKSMTSKYDISPGVKHYSCMIDLLARGGHIDEAAHLIHEMNIEPSSSMWGAVLRSCMIHMNVSLGETAARQLFYLDPKNCSYYVGVSGLYATMGLWDSAAMTRTQIQDRSLKKVVGCSNSLVTTGDRLALRQS